MRIFLLVLALNVMAWGQEARVRTSLDGTDQVWVGQRAVQIVELLAPGIFSGAAAFDLPKTTGLILTPPVGSPIVSSETIEDTAYTVQRYELSVFARKPGEQVIPGFRIRFFFKRHPLDKEVQNATVTTEAVPFMAKVPPGAETLTGIISAKELVLEESWKPEPGRAKAGDAFTRVVTFSAPDVPAMAFPPFPVGKVDGLGVYPKAPEVLDESERGSLTGRRRDTIVYVCERAGHFVIPEVRLTWFDLDSQKLQTITLPARVLDVASNPALALAAPVKSSAREENGLPSAVLAALGLNGLAALAWVTRAVWRPVLDALRPIHLAPLNPSDSTPQPLQPR